MKVSVSLLPGLDVSDEATDAVVVIDVLRATTVMTTALAAGASEIFACTDVAPALALADAMTPRPLLCGERHCRPIAGFDLGNAPFEYAAARVSGRSLVLSTTNGTRAIGSVKQVCEIYAGSFLNLGAVVRLLTRHRSVQLICAGTDGEITAEDVLLAGAILERLTAGSAVILANDACRLALHHWQHLVSSPGGVQQLSAIEARVGEELGTSLGGRNLIAAGYEADLAHCARIDTTDVVARCVSREPLLFRAWSG